MKTLRILALICVVVVHTVNSQQLQGQYIQDNDDALCNDFSKAMYYIEEPCAHCSNQNWVIFFEGGGGCSTFQDCNERWQNYPEGPNPLMSSRQYPSIVTGRGLLSSNPNKNPLFHDYRHVLVPYCTQDAFLANRSNPNVPVNTPFKFNSTYGADNFVYKGRVIFQSLFENLINDYGLGNASTVVLAGSSAGGVGILNNLEWVEQRLERASQYQSPELSVIIDSSWFVMFDGYHAVDWNDEVPRLLDLPEACHDRALGFSCCTSPACLITRGHLLESSPPIFAVSSIYDIFTLEGALRNAINRFGYNDDQALLRVFNSYGSLLNQTFMQSYTSHPNLTLYTPSCTQHVYLATSTLWDQGAILNRTVQGAFDEGGIFMLTNPISSDHWNQIRVRSVDPTLSLTLHEAIQNWYNSSFSQLYYTDSGCVGPVCGTCQSEVILDPFKNIWPLVINVVILMVAALMTVVPVSIKLAIHGHMKYMLYKQRVYAYGIMHDPLKNKPHFPKSLHPVSVACTELYYRIDTKVNNHPQNTNGTDQIDGAAANDLTEEQYNLYAAFDTCFPSPMKKAFSKYVQRVNQPVYDHMGHDQVDGKCCSNDSILSPAHLRSDSGISSSITRPMATPASLSSNSTANSLENLLNDDGIGGPTNQLPRDYRKMRRNLQKKTILRQVNMYVNPGELVAVMGPSGSGKTTLLDVILGRRRAGHTEGDIFINGIPLQKMRDWFVINTGYVRQLATSFYNELTVRENLLFSMNMQAQNGSSLSSRLKRVEQVIREMGLQEQADVVVGDGIGLGLSGGQRKRLAIAVQLLSMPSIIFLDEPTSGLDSASSLDILKSLQAMAGTGRAIVVTIHQPRSEIFHAFDKILLLCNGQVAFFGSPVKVWEFFRKALISEKELVNISGQVQDLVLDLLKEKDSQKQVLHAYRESKEPKKVKSAILESRDDTDNSPPPIHSRYPGFWYRLLSLEGRASLRQTIFSIIYLPIVYTVFGIILGTTYLFTDQPVQIMSVTCLLSCSSSLFMSSIVMSLLIEPLKLFRLEHSDGVALPHELILQVFMRMSAISTLPLSVCATIVFLLVYQNYDLEVYLVVLLAFLLVNQVWISIFIVLTVLYPSQAHRLCPVFAAAGGFTCGFIVPKPLMPEYYRWIFYINPSFYAYSATTVVALEGNDVGCNKDSELECFRESGVSVLDRFGLSEVNPIENLVVLIGMVIIFIMLAVFILYLKSNFSIIRESFMAAMRARKSRVSAVSQGQLSTDSAPSSAVLRSIRKENGHYVPPGKASVSSKEERLSSQFLDSGYHEVKHTFSSSRASVTAPPGEDTKAGVGEDSIDSGEVFPGSATVHFATTPTNNRTSRIGSEGSDDVFLPSAEVEVITMEEEDEVHRRIQANRKWEERRRQIEMEFRRLRHLSINRNRAGRMRHSVSFGDDLEVEFVTGGQRNNGETKRRIMSSNPAFAGQPDFIRSASMPGGQVRPILSGVDHHTAAHQPTLETYNEIDEEDHDDVIIEEDMMGLPPKDIPHFRSAENVEALDMKEIPPQCIDAHSGSGSTQNEASDSEISVVSGSDHDEVDS